VSRDVVAPGVPGVTDGSGGSGPTGAAENERPAVAEPRPAVPAAAEERPARRRRSRFAGQWGGSVNPVLEPLFKTVRATHPKADLRLIERAYEVAAYYHRDQKRKSGDPYITHPLAVATHPR